MKRWRYVSRFEDRHGKPHYRFRRKGFKPHYFKNKPGSAAFEAEYHACMDGVMSPPIEIGAERTRPGTVSALIVAYYRSPEFLGLSGSTQATYRGIIERFRERHGDKRVAMIERQHIKAIIGARAETPAAANNLLRMIRMLMTFAVDIGMRKDDPTFRLRGFKQRSTGFHTWTEDEIDAFEAHHAIGTRPRLALDLLLYTAQRRSDVVRMGPPDVVKIRGADHIRLQQQKTSTPLDIPIHPDLAASIAAVQATGVRTFLVTHFGKPFTAAGFGNWFREQCNDAGLSHCSAHGLRKAASRRLAEAGATNQEIKSITGHRTEKEVSRYTAAADQGRLARAAVTKLGGPERERKLSNQGEVSQYGAAKPLKGKTE